MRVLPRRLTTGPMPTKYGYFVESQAHVSARSHRGRATLRFRPLYSPDFNPIEKAFCRLKALLRKAGERTVSGLWGLIGRLVDIFQPHPYRTGLFRGHYSISLRRVASSIMAR